MQLLKRIISYIDSQYGNPTGALGKYIGEKMVKQHQPETYWTIDLLALNKDEKVLELGCGAGFAMKLLLQKSSVRKITGLDISETVLKLARKRNSHELTQGSASLVQGDVKQLPFENQQFTRVYSIQSIYFWDHIEETTSEIYRVLKPKGKVVLTLSNGKSGVLWGGINEMIETTLIPAMNRQGFKNIEIQNGPDSRQYHTIAIICEK
jgi:ubiquinone/menaquinone biosynthesis C-methylase UbiE